MLQSKKSSKGQINKEVVTIELNQRQLQIIEIVKENQPITGEQIAEKLKVTRATLRPDLSILTMSGILDARPKVGYFFVGKSTNRILSEYIQKLRVEEIKSIPVIVEENTNVYDAIVTLFLEDVGTIFVTNKGYLTGVVSRKDFLKMAIGSKDINRLPVGMIMTRMPNIVYVTDNESVISAASKIIEHEVDSLPVVEKIDDEKGKDAYKIVGKISKTSITKVFVELGK